MLYRCSFCKKDIEEDDFVEEDKIFYCSECFWERHFVCRNCGNVFLNKYMLGDLFCKNCQTHR